jgi:hypothetical protein
MKRKINLIKGPKNSKEWESKLTQKIKTIFWLNGEIEKNNNFYKRVKKKS